MKNTNEKYAHLQRTSWPQYANTTLGNLSSEKFHQIEADYEAQMAKEASQVGEPEKKPAPDVPFPTGDSMNASSGNALGSGDGSHLTPSLSQQGSSDVADQAEPVATETNETPAEIKSPDDLYEEAMQEVGEKGQL